MSRRPLQVAPGAHDAPEPPAVEAAGEAPAAKPRPPSVFVYVSLDIDGGSFEDAEVVLRGPGVIRRVDIEGIPICDQLGSVRMVVADVDVGTHPLPAQGSISVPCAIHVDRHLRLRCFNCCDQPARFIAHFTIAAPEVSP